MNHVEKKPQLSERTDALSDFVELARRWHRVGGLKVRAATSDYRLLAVNVAIRRQQEAMRAATILARQGFGYLAAAFVRPALEDALYLGFLLKLDRQTAQYLIKLLGRWDGYRSVLAQRAYLGDTEMVNLWYSIEFLDSIIVECDEVKKKLKALGRTLGWEGGVLPSAAWIAQQAGKKDLYDYLFQGSSRAIHFSIGEIWRHSWAADPDDDVATHGPFQDYITEFALDQLFALYAETWGVAEDVWQAAGITRDIDLSEEDIDLVMQRITSLRQVPLVHANEWGFHKPVEN